MKDVSKCGRCCFQQENSTTSDESTVQMIQLFRKVHLLLFLKTLYTGIAECFAMYDLSISIFFSGNGGLVVITMTLLIQLILSAYLSSSGPDSPSHQSHFILLALMEGLIWAGSVAHLYHIHMITLVDVMIATGGLGAFQLGHVLFFIRMIRYHAGYGVLYAGLCIVIPLVAVNISWISSYTSGDNSDDMNDDESILPLGLVGAISALICSLWYVLETHVVLNGKHRFRFGPHDGFFVLLCFCYADVWNVLEIISK